MRLAVMLFAKPFDIKRLGVIVMMPFSLCSAPTWLFLNFAAPDSVVEKLPCSSFYRIIYTVSA